MQITGILRRGELLLQRGLGPRSRRLQHFNLSEGRGSDQDGWSHWRCLCLSYAPTANTATKIYRPPPPGRGSAPTNAPSAMTVWTATFTMCAPTAAAAFSRAPFGPPRPDARASGSPISPHRPSAASSHTITPASLLLLQRTRRHRLNTGKHAPGAVRRLRHASLGSEELHPPRRPARPALCHARDIVQCKHSTGSI
jgi:hypothetical protein